MSKGKNVENKNVERPCMTIKKKNPMLYCSEHDSFFQY